MTHFGIAGVQMQVSAFAPNLERMSNWMHHIKKRFPWVSMVVFSELSALGPQQQAHPEPLPGPTEATLCQMAKDTGLWLIPGSIFESALAADGRTVIYNTASVINPQGEVIRRYRKMFPFRPYEHDVQGGSEFCVFDVPDVGRFGVSICYDMWIPETTRTMVAMGAEVILHPTMTDTLDRDVELSIARASAATNQVYFFDINGAGDAGSGRSIIVDPAGLVLHQAAAGAEVMPVEVDLGKVRRERERGLRGCLGQPLKSFRDRDVDFTVYQRDSGVDAYLRTLGPLTKPTSC